YRTCKVRRLKAATLGRLLDHLLDAAGQEPDFSHIFLSTYRTFTSPAQLIEMLFHRENATSDLDNSGRCNRVSAAVGGPAHSQPNFCSLAGQADALLRRFQQE
ncbi:hypothetical protein CRUP_011623, partial [Coryphaenoides rupestris]